MMNAKPQDVVGVDVGGSGVRAGRLTPGGDLVEVRRVSLDSREPSRVIDAVASVIKDVGPGCPVGVGVPGFVRDGCVLASPNFPSWREVPVRELLSEKLGVRVAVENDANAATLGAWARHRCDLVLLTLGTGVGGGVVAGGRLLRGAGGTGAELGHIHVGGARRCGCGAMGCLEASLGTSALVDAAADVGLKVSDGAALLRYAEAGHADASTLISAAGVALGKGLATLVNVFNPDRVVISGGLAHAGPILWQAAEPVFRSQGIGACVDWVEIVWRPDAADLAILGAAEAARG